jgi:hypothetical protein
MRTTVLAALFVLSAGILSAQQGPGGRRFGMAIEELTEKLQLDSTQQEKIRPLISKFEADTKGARETMMGNMQKVRNGETTREAVQVENGMAMMVVREHLDTLTKSVRAVLRPDQIKVFDEWLAERARRMAEMRRPPTD